MKKMFAGLLSAAVLAGGAMLCVPAGAAAAASVSESKPKTMINEKDMKLYSLLLSCVKEVANGERVSTVFDVPIADLKLDTYSFSAADLGTPLTDSNGITDAAFDAIAGKVIGNLDMVINTLTAECPYEMFWYDVTKGVVHWDLFNFSRRYDAGGTEYLTVSGKVQFYFSVADDYAAGENEVDPAAVSRAQNAAQYADTIIAKYAGASDVEKLIGYKDEICALTSYNDNAAAGSSYGDPFQMINVFDRDPQTNVVCEGYSKAFQYLCDNTAFSADISSIMVGGVMGGSFGSGKHMWNVVTDANGNHFIVDVTNTDADSVGTEGGLFLNGYTSGDLDSWYRFAASGELVTYIYDNQTRSLYDPAMLTLCSAASDFTGGENTPPAAAEITAQPKAVAAFVGETAVFTIAATGDDLSYRWQYYDGTWHNTSMSGAKTDTLSVPVIPGRNGLKYRCIVKDGYGNTVKSNAVKLTVKPAITAQPTAVAAFVSETAQFSVSATGAGLTYQWQYYDGEWHNTSMSGAKTAALRVPVIPGRNGLKYRCIITDANGKVVKSNAVKLTVKPAITAQPTAVTAAVGETAKFSVTATGAGLTYQWQYYDGTWHDTTMSGAKTATLRVPAIPGRDGLKYRCIITDANGKVVKSNAVKLTVV